MKYNLRKKLQEYTFSYLDIFFLLILGFLLSMLLFASQETGKKKAEVSYQVEVSALVDQALLDEIPKMSETILDSKGEEIGKILSVKTELLGNQIQVNMVCILKKEGLKKGDQIQIETKNFVSTMQLTSDPAENKEDWRTEK